MTTYRERHLAGVHANPDEQAEASLEQLREQAKALNVPANGTKAELQKRLDKARENA